MSPFPGRKRIVVASFGSLGDLHPYLAIALQLQRRGHSVAIATGECYRGKIEGLGLDYRPVRPDNAWVQDPQRMRYFAHPRWGLIRVAKAVMAELRESYTELLAATAGADLLVANQGQIAARLVAEKIGLAWISAMHIPLRDPQNAAGPVNPTFSPRPRAAAA